MGAREQEKGKEKVLLALFLATRASKREGAWRWALTRTPGPPSMTPPPPEYG